MTIFFRNDSDNITHQVWAQEQPDSCAIASIWMARNQAKQMTFKESEWALAWRTYHTVIRNQNIYPAPPPPMSLDPIAFQHDGVSNQGSFGDTFARDGSYMPQVSQALRNDGLRIKHATKWSPGATVSPAFLSNTSPAIVLLGWYRGKQRHGGHFIVASRKTRSGRIVYLDPWHGQLRELGVGPAYQQSGKFEQIIYISS